MPGLKEAKIELIALFSWWACAAISSQCFYAEPDHYVALSLVAVRYLMKVYVDQF